MASISEQIVAAAAAALTGHVAGVGSRVFRSRQDAIVRGECPCISVESLGETAEPADLADQIVRAETQFQVTVHVAAGDPFETAADTILVAAHALIVGATYPVPTAGLISSMAHSDAAESGDATPASRSVVYTCTYYRSASALDVLVT